MSKKPKTPLEAIHKYCKQCSGGQKEEVLNCPVKTCELYQFRIELTQLDSVELSTEPEKPQPSVEKVKPRITTIDEDLPIDEDEL
jgi:hypothetical protein